MLPHHLFLSMFPEPAIAPLTTLGMFEVEETKLHRDIYVRWQTIDPLFENGPDFVYEVEMYNSHEGYVWSCHMLA